MKKIQINIDWSMMFWIGILTIFLWLMARAVGLIKTPWFIEIIPYLGGLIVIFSLVKEVGKYVNKVDMVITDVREMKVDIKEMKLDINNLDKRVTILERVIITISRKLGI